MAKAKKKAAKKSAAKKSVAKKKTVAKRAPGRPKKRALTPEQRAALLAPRAGWAEIVDDVVRAMEATGLRVDGVSRARLSSLAQRALRAAQREEILVEKQRAALEPVADARRLAADAAWRALLDVVATVRFKARRDPSLQTAFRALLDLMRNEPSAPSAPSEPANG